MEENSLELKVRELEQRVKDIDDKLTKILEKGDVIISPAQAMQKLLDTLVDAVKERLKIGS